LNGHTLAKKKKKHWDVEKNISRFINSFSFHLIFIFLEWLEDDWGCKCIY